VCGILNIITSKERKIGLIISPLTAQASFSFLKVGIPPLENQYPSTVQIP